MQKKAVEHRDNETWIAELRGQTGKQEQAAAFQDLGNVLLSCIRWYLNNRAALPAPLASASHHVLDQLAHDIVQESLLHIWQRGLDLFRGQEGAKFINFAKVIAINQARQTLRRMRRHPEELLPSHSTKTGEIENDEAYSILAHSRQAEKEIPPEKWTIVAEVLQCVDCILDEQCTAREKTAFVSKYRDGFSSKEIAQSLETTEQAVNMLTFSARQKLRQGLEEMEYSLDEIKESLY